MSAIIDWISISLPHVLQPMATLFGDDGLTKKLLGEGGQWLEDWLGSFDDKEMMAGRHPYTKSIRSEYGGWRMFYGGNQPGCLVEISGMGCLRLREIDSDIAIVREFHNNITRIDIAVDIETDISPMVFVETSGKGKWKSDGNFGSGSGRTVYKGNKKSDRYARVYRYYEPHPRAKFLRVEMVSKGRAAKPTAAAVATCESIDDVAASLGVTYLWEHPVWSLRSETTIPAAPRRYKQSGTERWMLTQFLPAAEKLAAKGSVEVLTYVRDQLTILISEASKEV